MYYAPGLWPTRDGVIPHKLFVLLVNALRHLDALEELRTAHAGAYAQAVAWGAKDSSVKRYRKRLLAAAFPDDRSHLQRELDLLPRRADASTTATDE